MLALSSEQTLTLEEKRSHCFKALALSRWCSAGEGFTMGIESMAPGERLKRERKLPHSHRQE